MDLSKELDKILQVLAERFGTTVEYLWTVMVRYELALGITCLLWSVVGVVGIVVGVKIVRRGIRDWRTFNEEQKAKNHDHKYYSAGEPWLPITIISGGFLLAFTGCMLININLSPGILHVLSPEYFVLKTIIAGIK